MAEGLHSIPACQCKVKVYKVMMAHVHVYTWLLGGEFEILDSENWCMELRPSGTPLTLTEPSRASVI